MNAMYGVPDFGDSGVGVVRDSLVRQALFVKISGLRDLHRPARACID